MARVDVAMSPAAQQAILALVRRLRRDHPTSQLGVGGSWSSPKILLEAMTAAALWPACPLATALRDALDRREPGRSWRMVAWANVLVAGDCLQRHDHARSHLGGTNCYAAIYYPTAPVSPLTIYRGHAAEQIDVWPGLLLVFPATLAHGVMRYEDDGERLSLAFSIQAS